MTEDQMVGWHHQLNGHEFEQTPGDSEGQENLVCCQSTRSERGGHDLATELNINNKISSVLEIAWIFAYLCVDSWCFPVASEPAPTAVFQAS